MARNEAKTVTIQVLARAFSLLDVLASHQDPVSLKELSETTGLHPSTAHRILNDLAAAGDYIDGPYPSTLESAIRSGLAAARAVVAS
jgi:uncharacterized protein with NAD-binding domain and iron-sulfur cluster